MTIPNQTSLLLIFNPGQNQQQETDAFLKKIGALHSDKPNTHLNYLNQENETLKIAAARDLISTSAYGSYSGEKQFFIILHAENSSIPAQNALLKIVEEPPTNSQIILATCNPQQLLPTLHSRCHKVFLSNTEDSLTATDDIKQLAQIICTKKFSYNQAIKTAEQYQKREEGQELILKLLSYLHQQLATKTAEKKLSTEQMANVISKLAQCHQDLQNNLNPRLALEHCFFEIIESCR